MTITAPVMSSTRFERPQPDEYAGFYSGYVSRATGDDLITQLARQLAEWSVLVDTIGEGRASEPYAPGRWTTKDVILHVCDAERVFGYRMLRAARGDGTPLPGFEQDDYARTGQATARSLSALLDELTAVRGATLALLRTLSADDMDRRVTASGHAVSVRALAWIIAGHERHHLDVLRERLGVVPHAASAGS